MQRFHSVHNLKKLAARFASSSDWINYCIGYAPGAINRAGHLRKDGEQLRAAAAISSEYIVFMQTRPVAELVPEGNGDLQMSRYSPSEIQPYLSNQSDQPICVFLGMEGSKSVFLAGFDNAEEDLLSEKRQILRKIVIIEPLVDRRLFCYARSMLCWNKSNLFCGLCGSPTESRDAGHKRVCTNAKCARNERRSYGDHAASHPRTDPAVLVVLTDGERALLARKDSFPPSMISCIAGFLEPGETLEDAVVREVREETGLAVTSVRYLLSQPWPFDSVIKFGCLATVDSSDLVLDKEELSFAAWFSAAEVREMLEFRHPKWHVAPPRFLAYEVLDRWLKETAPDP